MTGKIWVVIRMYPLVDCSPKRGAERNHGTKADKTRRNSLGSGVVVFGSADSRNEKEGETWFDNTSRRRVHQFSAGGPHRKVRPFLCLREPARFVGTVPVRNETGKGENQ